MSSIVQEKTLSLFFNENFLLLSDVTFASWAHWFNHILLSNVNNFPCIHSDVDWELRNTVDQRIIYIVDEFPQFVIIVQAFVVCAA